MWWQAACRGVQDAAVAPPGFVNLQLDPGWYGEALGEILAAGPDYGAGSAAEPEKVQVEFVSANPTGPLTVASARNAAYGDSVARLLDFAGNTVEREFYVNDGGAQIDLFHAVGRGQAQGGGAAARRLPGGLRGRARRARQRPGEGDGGAHPRDTRALPRAHGPLGAPERDGAARRGGARRDRALREGRSALARDDRRGATTRTASCCAPTGGPTYFAVDVPHMRLKWNRGHERLIYVLGADHHGYIARLKAIAGALGHDPEQVEILIYQLVQLTRAARPGRYPSVGGTWSSSTSCSTRSASTRPAGTSFRGPRPGDGHRRRPRARAHREEPGVLRPVRARPDRRDRPERGGQAFVAGAIRPSAPAERELVKRLAEFPAMVAEATERRGPHALPTYAIRVADDFHRFYHDHRVLESEEEPFSLALCRATRVGDRPRPRPHGGRGARADVDSPPWPAGLESHRTGISRSSSSA